MPAVSPCQGGLADQTTSDPSDAPAKPINHHQATPSRLDLQRLRWLCAALALVPWLSPLEISAYATLLWRGKRWLSSDAYDDDRDPSRYRYGVIAGLDSLAASVGRQRPGRATDEGPPRANKALADACTSLVGCGLLDRENDSYQDPVRGRWHTTPYRWWRPKPARAARASMPEWDDAVHLIRRLAVQQSVHGPARDAILIRLALAADARGQITGTRDDLARICRVTPSTMIGHLQALAADDYGVRRAFRADGGGRRDHVWHVRLQVIPDGVTPGEARREHEAVVADARRKYNAAQAASAVAIPTGPEPGDDIPF